MNGDGSEFGVQRSANSAEGTTPNSEHPTPNFNRLYLIVLVELVITIAILVAFTRTFA